MKFTMWRKFAQFEEKRRMLVVSGKSAARLIIIQGVAAKILH
jgi:hypothetical protein